MDKENKEKVIKEILEEFDFEKVHEYMDEKGWGYGSDNEIPSIPNLVMFAHKLLDELLSDDDLNYVSTGGFTALRISGQINLQFSITEYFMDDEYERLEKDDVNECSYGLIDNKCGEINSITKTRYDLLKNSHIKLQNYVKSLEEEINHYRNN